jgi:hypothetical protein
MSYRVRFRLGPLLWFITILAIILGWWVDRRWLEARHRKETIRLQDEYEELRRYFALERERSRKTEYLLERALKASE